VSFRQGQFSRDNPQAQPLAWRVPVIAQAGGRPLRSLVTGQMQASVPGCGPLVVNYGQAGYYRTLYAPELIANLTRNYARLRPLDQIGLLADNWALGLAGYQSPAIGLDLVQAAPANGNAQLLIRIANIVGQLDDMYETDPAHRAMLARFAAEKLGPAMRRLGWAPRAGEPANDAVLRGQLITVLGGIGDPQVVAEARRRFAANDPSVTAGPLRGTILGIVAYHADEATWERLRTMARDERNPLVRVQLYQLLGGVRDETLARRALALALTEEPGATNASQIIGAVAGVHPDLAFDFALENRARVEPLVDASSRSRYFAALGTGSSDPAMIEKLGRYADQHMTPQSRAPADRAIASVRDRIRVRQQQRPEISRWLEARRG